MKTLSEIKKSGESPLLKSELLYKYARLKFWESNIEKAYKILADCNMVLIDNGLPENRETYYLVGRVYEARGNIKMALSAYQLSLERGRFIDDPEFDDEILDRINKLKSEE